MASLTNLCTSSRKMRPLGPLPLMWLSSTPSWRANFRTDGLACGFTVDSGAAEIGDGDTAPVAGAASPSGTGSLVSPAGTSRLASPSGAAASASSTMIGEPSETLSPTFTLSSLTTPA